MLEDNPRVSIIIPCYEMYGAGPQFLTSAIKSIISQDYKNIEIIVTDHSINSCIKDTCDSFRSIDIKHIKNDRNRGSSSANINLGILNSSGDIIKILMQDDFLFTNCAISNIVRAFIMDQEKYWLASGCAFGPPRNKTGEMIPTITDDILLGNNKIGSPSVLSIKKSQKFELFNDDLIWMMDCEYYHRLLCRYGVPILLKSIDVFISQHSLQITNKISINRKNDEERHVRSILYQIKN